jgi:hypothetical protein
MTLEHLRRTLHAELRHTWVEFEKHSEINRCDTDSSGCPARVRFQERIRTLNFALEQAGGRKMDESYQWGPVEGA